METLDQCWNAVRQKVCETCCDGDGAGGCMLSGEKACALKTSFPEIVNAVRSVKSNDVQPYTNAIRVGVCASCKHQSADGKCIIRTDVDCGLDCYLPLVIEAIELVDSAHSSFVAASVTPKFNKGDAS